MANRRCRRRDHVRSHPPFNLLHSSCLARSDQCHDRSTIRPPLAIRTSSPGMGVVFARWAGIWRVGNQLVVGRAGDHASYPSRIRRVLSYLCRGDDRRIRHFRLGTETANHHSQKRSLDSPNRFRFPFRNQGGSNPNLPPGPPTSRGLGAVRSEAESHSGNTRFRADDDNPRHHFVESLSRPSHTRDCNGLLQCGSLTGSHPPN